MDKQRFSKYFKAFSDPTRLSILEMLAREELSVGEITSRLGLAQPTVSGHLAVLREAEVVEARRDRQHVLYRLNKENVSLCCAGFCDCLEVRPRRRGPRRK
jgi:DNA-binding transcriptional ArsR family regulator